MSHPTPASGPKGLSRSWRLTVLLQMVIAGIVWAMAGSLGVNAAQTASSLDTRWARDTTHVVATLTLPARTRALVIEGPADASIQDVELLRYGVEAVDFEAEIRPTVWTLHFDTPQQGPFEVVVRVHTGAPTERATWRLIPFTGAARTAASLTRVSYAIEERPAGRETWAWAFSGDAEQPAASRPASATASRPLAPGRAPGAFTLAFWMRTMHRDVVVASTWTGAADAPYPLELVVGPAGRLQVYQGTGTAHHVVRTGTVVADGQWHYVAIAYAPRTRRTTVYIDEEQVARQQHPPRPSAEVPLVFGRRPDAPVGEQGIPEAALAPFTGQLAWVQLIPEVLQDEAIHQLRTTATLHDEALPYGPWPEGNGDASSYESTYVVVRAALPLPNPTPVSDWQAQVRGNEVVLFWTAGHDTGRYVVERSVDRSRWAPVTTHAAASGAPLSTDAHRYTATDPSPPADVVFYRVRYTVPGQPDRLSPVLKVGRGVPVDNGDLPRLIGNFPNPFRENTTIAFELPETAAVTLTVWTLSGRPVEEVVDRTFPAGYHEVAFQPRTLSSGTYFVRFEANGHIEAHRMVVVR